MGNWDCGNVRRIKMRYEIEVVAVFRNFRKKILQVGHTATKPTRPTIERIAKNWNPFGRFHSVAIHVKDTESNYEANYII